MQRDKVNVLLLTNGLGHGGAEVVIRDLARSIEKSRFNTHVGCLAWLGPIGRELAAEGIDVSVIGTGKADYAVGLTLRRYLRDKQIDVVHSHSTHALMVAAMCRAITPHLRLVHTFHFGNYPHRPARQLWIERIASRFADRLIAVGGVQREQIRATHALADGDIDVIRNGVEAPRSESVDPAFRSRFGAQAEVLVGTIASLTDQKGLFDLLAVARRVRDVRTDVRFVVIGDGVLRSALLEKRGQLGLDDVVSFPGWLANAATVALPAFDIYFQPSLWEAMSIAMLEAMAASKPVVSTLVGEAPRFIEQDRDGQLFTPGDLDGMSAAILKLASDPECRNRLGRAAAEKVNAQFTVAHTARAHEDLYLELLPRRQREELCVTD